MNSFAALIAALSLLAQVAGPRSEPAAFRDFRESYRPERQDQVRIEHHVIIRITPTRPEMRDELFAPPPRSDRPVRFREEKHGDCVEIEKIAGISPMEPNRLVMFMRNRHILSLALERTCDPDVFYLGAYVERSADGKLCSGRDTLRARSGATCHLAGISRLVAVKD